MSMNNDVKVSVVIPTYNDEKYLTDCLCSVIRQTLRDIEIICVNDGSTDNTFHILEDFKHKDSRIKVIHQSNKGRSAARNRALDAISGKYVVFMDSDDFYLQDDSLEQMYNALIVEKVKLCRGVILRYDGSSYTKVKHSDYMSDNEFFRRGIHYTKYDCIPFGWTGYMYDVALLNYWRIRFDALDYYEDPLFLYNVLSKTDCFFQIDVPSYVIRKQTHGNSYSYNQISQTLEATKRMCDIALETNNMTMLYNALFAVTEVGYTYANLSRFINSGDEYLRDILDKFRKLINAFGDKRFIRIQDKLDIKSISSSIEDATLYVNNFKRFVNESNKCIVYGAGSVGMQLGGILNNSFGIEPIGYTVTDDIDEKYILGGRYLCKSITDWAKEILDENIMIIIATESNAWNAIQTKLKELGIYRYFIFDIRKWMMVNETDLSLFEDEQ